MIESQDAPPRMRPDLERYDSESLLNVATCRLVLPSRVAEARGSLPVKTDSLDGFDTDIAFIEPMHTEKAVSNQACKGSSEIGGSKDH